MAEAEPLGAEVSEVSYVFTYGHPIDKLYLRQQTPSQVPGCPCSGCVSVRKATSMKDRP